MLPIFFLSFKFILHATAIDIDILEICIFHKCYEARKKCLLQLLVLLILCIFLPHRFKFRNKYFSNLNADIYINLHSLYNTHIYLKVYLNKMHFIYSRAQTGNGLNLKLIQFRLNAAGCYKKSTWAYNNSSKSHTHTHKYSCSVFILLFFFPIRVYYIHICDMVVWWDGSCKYLSPSCPRTEYDAAKQRVYGRMRHQQMRKVHTYIFIHKTQ